MRNVITLGALLFLFSGCGAKATASSEPSESTEQEILGDCVPGQVPEYVSAHQSLKTGYYPDKSPMEGGFKDRLGKPLYTLQGYLSGNAPYVSVAMDHTDARFPYGTALRIPDVEKAFGRCILFRVVDTGGAFVGKGAAKIDICNDTKKNTHQQYTNGWSSIFVVQKF